MEKISALEARRTFADLLNRVQYCGERIGIHRRGKTACVLIPEREFQLLEQLIADMEDRIDLHAFDEATRGGQRTRSVTWDSVRGKLDAKHGIQTGSRKGRRTSA